MRFALVETVGFAPLKNLSFCAVDRKIIKSLRAIEMHVHRVRLPAR